MKYIALIFTVSCVFFLAGCENNLPANDLVMVQRDAAGNVINSGQTNFNTATAPKKSDEATKVEPQKSSNTKVIVINSVTKKPVPGAPIVIPYSSAMFYADESGVVLVPQSYREFYVPKIGGYSGSGNISLKEGQKEAEILLQPEATGAGESVKYIYGSYTPTSDGGAQIIGTVTRAGQPVSGAVIVAAQSSLNAKTNDSGKFLMQAVNQSGAYRLYFPDENNKVYYQVDVFKGHAVNIDIAI